MSSDWHLGPKYQTQNDNVTIERASVANVKCSFRSQEICVILTCGEARSSMDNLFEGEGEGRHLSFRLP